MVATDREDLDRQLREVSALADTLRAAIASLDERVEERARELAAQRGPLTVSHLSAEVNVLVERLAELMRHTMLVQMPGERESTARIRPEEWMAHAASFLAAAYRDIARREEEKLERR
jgi:hypothetical protein